MLTSRSWPGNVRQLLNVIRNIVVLHDGTQVTASMLPGEIALEAAHHAPANDSVPPRRLGEDGPDDGGTLRSRVAQLVGAAMAEVERELIEATIAHCDGSIPRAARMLEVSPSTIYRKLEGWTGAQRRSGT